MSLFKGKTPIAMNKSGEIKPPEDIQDKKVSFIESSDEYDTALSKIVSGAFMRDIMSGVKRCLRLVIRKQDALTLEEIEASTSLEGKVPSAQAFGELNTTIKNTQRDQNLYVNTTGEYLYSTGKTFSIPRNGVLIIYFYKEYVGNTIFVYRNGIRKGTFANYFSSNVYSTLQLNVTAGDIITVNTDVESSEIHINYKLLQVTLI